MAAGTLPRILYVLDQLMPLWLFFLILVQLLLLRLRFLRCLLISLICSNITLRLLVLVLDKFADLLFHQEK